MLCCVAACAVASVTDLRRREIPDWITVPGVLGGMALHAAIPALQGQGVSAVLAGLASSAVAGTVLFAASGVLGWRGLLGMGDVKLYAAVGALLAWPAALEAALASVVAGGVLSVAWALRGGVLGRTLANLAVLTRTRTFPRVADEDGAPPADAPQTTADLPYGVAILAGVVWTVAATLA
jgi:prepilin peptidase CpaA